MAIVISDEAAETISLALRLYAGYVSALADRLDIKSVDGGDVQDAPATDAERTEPRQDAAD